MVEKIKSNTRARFLTIMFSIMCMSFFWFVAIGKAYPFVFTNKQGKPQKSFEVTLSYVPSTYVEGGWAHASSLGAREFGTSTSINLVSTSTSTVTTTAVLPSIASSSLDVDGTRLSSVQNMDDFFPLRVSSTLPESIELRAIYDASAYGSVFSQVINETDFDRYRLVYASHRLPTISPAILVSSTAFVAQVITHTNFVTSSLDVASSTFFSASSSIADVGASNTDPIGSPTSSMFTPESLETGSEIDPLDFTIFTTSSIPVPSSSLETGTIPAVLFQDSSSSVHESSSTERIEDLSTIEEDSDSESLLQHIFNKTKIYMRYAAKFMVALADDASVESPTSTTVREIDDTTIIEEDTVTTTLMDSVDAAPTVEVPASPTTSTIMWNSTSTSYVSSTITTMEFVPENDHNQELVSSSLYASTMEVYGFGLANTDASLSGTELKNTHFSISFAHATHPNDILFVEYLYLHKWQALGIVDLSSPVPAGTLKIETARFPLSIFESIPDVENARFRISYLTETPLERKSVYIDTVTLEAIYSAVEDERVLVESSPAITVDTEKTTFIQGEQILFTFFYDKSSTSTIKEPDSLLIKIGKKLNLIQDKSLDFVEAYVVDVNGSKVMDATPYITFLDEDKSVFEINLPKHFDLQPSGEYHLILRAVKGKQTYTFQQDFAKGVLALNVDQETYEPGSTAFIQMASLDSVGHTLCDSALVLTVIKPDNTAEVPEIIQSGECAGDTVVSIPDYSSYMLLDQVGTYTAVLEDKLNDYRISIPFHVAEELDMVVTREGPTRIYPPAPYPMRITVTPKADFKGFIIEEIPADFTVLSIAGDFDGSEVKRGRDRKAILWSADLQAGHTYDFSYVFDAPDISPYMFYLGPLSLGGSIAKNVHPWQIASDAIETRIAWLQGTQTTNSTNLNGATAYPILWNTSTVDSVYFTHSTGTPERLTIKTAGDYLLSLTVPMQSTDADTSVETLVKVNGTAYQGGVSRSSYISASGGHNESSNHLSLVVENLSVNDYVEIYAKKVAVAGTVTVKDTASMYLEYIPDSGKNIYTGYATSTVNSTNFNTTTPYALKWSESRSDIGYLHSNTYSPENITLQAASLYYVSMNIPLEGTAAHQSVGAHIMLDGVEVSPDTAGKSYISNQSGHNSASLHWAGFIKTASSHQVLTINVKQEAASGTVTVLSGQKASIAVQKLNATNVFAASGGTLNNATSTDWNPSVTSSIRWTLRSEMDTDIFAHSTSTNPHQITISTAGNYVIAYADALSSNFSYVNPVVQVYVNGQPVSGAIGSTHFIRNAGSHSKSSASFFMYLNNVQANDVVTVQVVAEGAYGVVTEDRAASVLIWRKPTIQPSDTPSVSSVVLNGNQSISLVEGDTQAVNVSASITDINGYADIAQVTARVYRSGVTNGYNCSSNDNNCYATLCSLSSCLGNTCTATCPVEIRYHADPTATNTPWASEYWLARVTATDESLSSASNTSTANLVDVASLIGFSVGSQVNFGAIDYAQSAGVMTSALQLQSLGNSSIDFQMYGSNLTYTTSSGTYTIPASYIHFATSSGITYASGTVMTTSSNPLTLYLPLAKVTDQNTAVTTSVWFGLYPPVGLPSAPFSGTVTILGFLNSLPWP